MNTIALAALLAPTPAPAMTDPTFTPSAPVPPVQFVKDTLRESRAMACPERYAANKFAAWGYTQALPERQELPGMIVDLLELIEPRWEYDWRGNVTNAHPNDVALVARARAWVDRIDGGNSDD